jgi:hypothetical protein
VGIKKALIKELLIYLDEKSLKNMSKKDIDNMIENIGKIVVKTVPSKKENKLKLIKTG